MSVVALMVSSEAAAVVPPAVMAMRSTRAVESGAAVRNRSRICSAATFWALPVHAGGLAVVDLHAVHAYVALGRSCDLA